MAAVYEIVVNDTSAQDLFFIEKEVLGAKVVEQPKQLGTTEFGMPGVIEAVILVSAISAASGALMWLLKNRKRVRVKVRRLTTAGGTVEEEIDLNMDQSESPDALLQKIDAVIRSLMGVG